MQFGIPLAQLDNVLPGADLISPDWILLDSGLTVCSINNVNLLSNLNKSDEVMHVFTNGRSQDYANIGILKLFPFNVIYNPQSLAKILSLAQVLEMSCLTMDTNAAPTMMVRVSPETMMPFQQCGSGLHYYDTATNENSQSTVIPYSFLSTLQNNKEYFNRQEI